MTFDRSSSEQGRTEGHVAHFGLRPQATHGWQNDEVVARSGRHDWPYAEIHNQGRSPSVPPPSQRAKYRCATNPVDGLRGSWELAGVSPLTRLRASTMDPDDSRMV